MEIKKTIFALYGTRNVGKTETIKIIYDLLKKDLLKTKYSISKCEEYPEEAGGEKEILVVMEINDGIKNVGIKIGIASQGDSPPCFIIDKSLKKLIEEKQCQIVVCATKNWGKTCEAVYKYENKFEFKPDWITKEVAVSEKKQNCINKKQANEVLEKIENLIKKDKQ
ncbi:MAG: hypothetical protein K0U66_01710 [Gammaproteobacteria bacterium]|nr:hypothetical protein [Gammaproteobacteria bacterium]